MVPMALDTTIIDSTISDLATALPGVLSAGLGVAVLSFGIAFLWRRAKAIMGA